MFYQLWPSNSPMISDRKLYIKVLLTNKRIFKTLNIYFFVSDDKIPNCLKKKNTWAQWAMPSRKCN